MEEKIHREIDFTIQHIKDLIGTKKETTMPKGANHKLRWQNFLKMSDSFNKTPFKEHLFGPLIKTPFSERVTYRSGSFSLLGSII